MKTFKTFLIEQENLIEWGSPKVRTGLVSGMIGAGILATGLINPPTQDQNTDKPIPQTTKTEIDNTPSFLPKETKAVPSTEAQYAKSTIEKFPIHHFIAKHEGFEAKAYQDPGKGIWTIGYGTTRYKDGRPVKQGDVMTHEEALDHLDHHIQNTIHPTLERTIPTWSKMNPHQKAAITSFAYNLGHNFYGRKNFETISKHLGSGNWDGVRDALHLYNKAGGKTLPGLVRRRAEESELFGYSGADGELYSTNVNREK
jgi:GH24 family phage-related lysozyme (muramidase)